MSTTKEIKNRMTSVRDTQKITNAMYLIASTKLRKAKSDLDMTRPYFNAVLAEIKRIFRINEDVESRYFYPPSGEHELPGSYGYLVITADKGLAGAYNHNVIKEAERMMAEHDDPKLFV
ncbi:MAG: F0F1 ATP synthase subunit gamma, partial [Clostridia bacterium]|nr:F0F1 ATP synthase subunit gamma [Clostridia bacterium]